MVGLLMGTALHAQGTAPALALGTVAVGSSVTGTVTFTFPSSGSTTVSAISVVTQGASGLDFTLNSVAPGTCAATTYAASSTCTVGVKFTPTYPGRRLGAVVLGTSAAPVATGYVSGTGSGGLLLAQSGALAVTFSTSLNVARGAAVDGSGNVYINEQGSGHVDKFTPTGVESTLTTNGNAVSGGAIDGAGNYFFGNSGTSTIAELVGGVAGTPVTIATLSSGSDNNLIVDGAGNLYTTLSNTGELDEIAVNTHTVTTLIAGGNGRRFIGLGIDASANLYPADFNNSVLYEVVAGSGTLTQLVSGNSLANPAAVVVDAAGNIYVENNGGGAILRYAAGTYALTTLTTTGSAGLAIGPDGTLYAVTSNSTLVSYSRLQPVFPVSGTTAVGSTSAQQTATIENDGTVSATISSAVVVSPAAAGGSNTCTASTVLSLTANCTLAIDFAPTTHGPSPQNGTLTLNGPASPLIATISGDVTGDPTQLAFTTAPPTPDTTGSANFTVVVTQRDSAGVTAAYNTSASVTVTVTGPSSYSQAYTMTETNSVATFSLPVPAATGTYTYTATSTGLPSAIATQVVNSGNATQLAYTAAPPAANAGAATSTVTVTVETSTNTAANTDTTAAVTLTVTGPNSYSQTYGPTSATNSVVSFTPPTPTIAGTYTYTATSSGLTSAVATQAVSSTGIAVSITATAASTALYVLQPDNITVTEFDTYGNVVTTDSDSITLTATDPAATVPGNFNLSSGRATQPVTFHTAGSFTVKATDNSNALTATTASISVGAAPQFVITSSTGDTSGTCTNQAVAGATADTACTVSAAMAAVTALNNTSTSSFTPQITFAPALYGTTITMLQSTTVTGNVALIGPGANGANNITLSGNSLVGFLTQTSNGNTAFTGLTFTHFKSSTHGGVLLVASGPVVFTNDVFTNNTATGNGGVLNNGIPVTVSGSTFTSNSATGLGGALTVGTGIAFSVTNSVFTSNSASNGGAIYQGASGGTTTLTNDSFLSNSATGNGGAVYNTQILAVSGSYFYGNKVNGSSSSSYGGAVYQNFSSGSNSITGSAFIGNSNTTSSSYAYGGALSDQGGVIKNTLFYNNTATAQSAAYGGGASISAVTLTGLTFTGNTSNFGGGLYFMLANPVYNSTVTGNTAKSGGGAYKGTGESTMTAYNTVLSGNTATTSYRDEYSVAYGGTNYLDSSTTTTCTAPTCTPYLSALGNYGGPVIGAPGGLTATTPAQATGASAATYQNVATFTMIPLPGSPLLGAATSGIYLNGASTDQRGTGYPRGTAYAGSTHYDIGAAQANYTLGFVQEPTNTASGTTITPPPTVQIYESGALFSATPLCPTTTPTGCDGSVQNASVAFASTTGTLGTAAGSVGSTGLVTLNSTITNAPIANDTLTATVKSGNTGTPTLANATSGYFNITDATAATIAYVTPPTANVVNGGNAGTVQVGLYASGTSSPDTTNSSAVVTLTVTASGYTTQTYMVTVANGVATFNLSGIPLTVNATYTYAATAASYTADTASAIETVAAATIGSFTVTGVAAKVFPGVSYTFTVTAKDTTGTKLTTFTGPVFLTSSDAAATITPSSYTFNSTDAGVHTFTVVFSTAGTQTITATTDGGQTGSESGIVVTINYVWLVNDTGSIDKLYEGGSAATGAVGISATASTLGGLAFDSTGNVWSVSSQNNALDFNNKSGTGSASYSGGGLNAPVAVMVDGAGSIWIANSGNASVSEFTNAGAAASGTSGYGTSGTAAIGSAPSSIAIDNAGGIWIASKTGNTVTHLLGAGVPVTTPLSTAVTNTTVGVKP